MSRARRFSTSRTVTMDKAIKRQLNLEIDAAAEAAATNLHDGALSATCATYHRSTRMVCSSRVKSASAISALCPVSCTPESGRKCCGAANGRSVPIAVVAFGHRIAQAPGMARTDDAGVQSPCWEVGYQGDWIRVCRPKAGARACFANKRLRAVWDKRLPKPVYWPATSMGTEGARGISAQKNRQGARKVGSGP